MTSLSLLADSGVSVWLDDLGRKRIESGELSHLVNEVGVVGITTNPSIFAAAVRDGSAYDSELAGSDLDPEAALHELMVQDVQDACTVLSDTFTRTSAVDGRVSFEVDPRLALDTAGTVKAAAQIWGDVDRPNVMIKIPATKAGLPAITQTLAAGISVNVTLIFGIDRYREVQNAWLDGMEQAKDNGHDLSQMTSVASFFVSRLDTEVDKRLDDLLAEGDLSPDTHVRLRGRAAIANAHNAYRDFAAARKTERWTALERAGAHVQRPLWASTSTKDPTFAPTRYVDELVAPDTVNTMPAKTLDAVLNDSKSVPPPTISTAAKAVSDDTELFTELRAIGIDYDEVVGELERAGVQSFTEAWETLLELIAAAQKKSAG